MANLCHFLVLILASCASAQDYVDECPEPNGFYADAVQCDRYYECKDSQISDKLCPDGLVFDEDSIQFAKCSFPFATDCDGRDELQRANPTQLCPRQNGYFVHEDPTVCDKFYFCVDGIANPLTCPESLIFNPKTGQCAYSDQVNREGCSSSEFFQFNCPNDPNNAHAHPRYPDPTDCQYFFLCLNGKDARRNGCQTGLLFNQKTQSCDRQENLAPNDPCRGYYNETFLEGLRGGPSGLPQVGRPAGFKKTGTGIQLNTKNRQRVAVIRKKKVRPQQNALGTAQQPARSPTVGQAVLTGSRRRVPADSRIRAQQNSFNRQQAVEDKRTRPPLRTRVRNPNLPGFSSNQEPVEEASAGPPQFALSDEDSIQKFRDSLSNRFAPENSRPANRNRVQGGSGNGRLTVLSANNFRRRVPAADSQPSITFEPQDDPKSELGSFSAVPSAESSFGNRFRSRRPPSFQDSNSGSQAVKSLPVRENTVRRTQASNSERIQQVEFEDDEEFGAALNAFNRRTRNPTREEIKSLPIRKQGDRLQVTKIDIQPQFDLAEVVGDALDRQEGVGIVDNDEQFSSFPTFESGRQRSRGQQG